MNLDKIALLSEMLDEVGAILDEECAENTAKRWIKMIKHYCQQYDPSVDLSKAFNDPKDLGDKFAHGMVIQCNIPYRALCAHHLAPVLGIAHVGYIPHQKVVGLSKLARVVYGISHSSPSLQEHVGASIVKAFMDHLHPLGAMCIISAEHGCMACRGVEEHHISTITSHTRGVFSEHIEARNEFLQIVHMNTKAN